MVKSVSIDEPQLKSSEGRLFNSNPPSEVGLIVGKLNPTLDRAFVFDLIPTPPNDTSQPASSLTSTTKKSSKTLLFDADWISEHALQLSRMLLGGVSVIGIYIYAPESAFAPSTAPLLQLIRALGIEKDAIVVHICYSPRKLVVRGCVGGGFRVCEFKLGRVLGALRRFKCLFGFELQLPITKGGKLGEIVREGVVGLGRELKGVRALIDGRLVGEDDDKLCVSNDGDGDGEHIVELLLPVGGDFFGGKEDGEIIGVVVFKGFVCAVAYLSPKENVRQVVSDVKGDIVSSLQSRLNIMYDEAEEESDDSGAQCELSLLKKTTSLCFPRRVLVPWIGDAFVCDYLQRKETVEVVKDHCKELMSMEVPEDGASILEPETEAISLTVKSFWDVVVPNKMPLGSDSNSMTKKEKDSMQKEGGKPFLKSATFSSVAAIVILLLAIVIGRLLYNS